MRVLIILAAIALTTAAPQKNAAKSSVTRDAIAVEIDSGIQRFLRSTDESESTTDDVNEGVLEANDLSKEIAEEAHWAAEEKKWQEQARAESSSAKQDGEAANTNEDDSEAESSEELAEESLWLVKYKKWDNEENQGTEATELDEESGEQEDSDAVASSESLIPAVLVEGVDLTNPKNVVTLIPQLSLIPNNYLPWIYPGAYSTWIYQFPQYYRVPGELSTS